MSAEQSSDAKHEGSPHPAPAWDPEEWTTKLLEYAKPLDVSGIKSLLKLTDAPLGKLVLKDAIGDQAFAGDNSALLQPLQLVQTYFGAVQTTHTGSPPKLSDETPASGEKRTILLEWMRGLGQEDIHDKMNGRDFEVLDKIAPRNTPFNSRTLEHLGDQVRKEVDKITKNAVITNRYKYFNGKLKSAWKEVLLGPYTSPDVMKPMKTALNTAISELQAKKTGEKVDPGLAMFEHAKNLLEMTEDMYDLVKARVGGDAALQLKTYENMMKRADGRSVNTFLQSPDFGELKTHWFPADPVPPALPAPPTSTENSVNGDKLLAVFDHVSNKARADFLSMQPSIEAKNIMRRDMARNQGGFLERELLPLANPVEFGYKMLTDPRFLGPIRLLSNNAESNKDQLKLIKDHGSPGGSILSR